MSWQEKIERRKQEEARAQNETQRKLTEEQERQRIEKVEKIKPLLQTLEDLKCREMLTQIRDEVWKLGEVTVSPGLDEVTHDFYTEIVARIMLTAQWTTRYRGNSDQPEWLMYAWIETLGIVASYKESFKSFNFPNIDLYGDRKRGEGKIAVGISSGSGSDWGTCHDWTIVDENTSKWLEEKLIEDCIRQGRRDELPYGEKAKKAELKEAEYLKKEEEAEKKRKRYWK